MFFIHENLFSIYFICKNLSYINFDQIYIFKNYNSKNYHNTKYIFKNNSIMKIASSLATLLTSLQFLTLFSTNIEMGCIGSIEISNFN